MIWIILLIALIITVIGVWLYQQSINFETAGIVIGVIGGVASAVAAIVAVVLTIYCADTTAIDEKVEMYETENAKIEQQMTIVVQNYQEYEKEIFGEVNEQNVMSIITLYPELRSNSLVEKQMTIYYSNYEKITELKEEQLIAPVYRWWVYFGR